MFKIPLRVEDGFVTGGYLSDGFASGGYLSFFGERKVPRRRKNQPIPPPDLHTDVKQKEICMQNIQTSFICGIIPVYAFLAMSHRAVNATASLIAISESILRLISMPATFRPCMKLE